MSRLSDSIANGLFGRRLVNLSSIENRKRRLARLMRPIRGRPRRAVIDLLLAWRVKAGPCRWLECSARRSRTCRTATLEFEWPALLVAFIGQCIAVRQYLTSCSAFRDLSDGAIM